MNQPDTPKTPDEQIFQDIERKLCTWNDIANQLGISKSYLSKMRHGEKPVPENLRAKLLEIVTHPTPDPNMADSPPLTPEDELDIILTTFNNRIRREPRLKDPDAIVRDFIENHAETLAKLKAREARIRIDELERLALTFSNIPFEPTYLLAMSDARDKRIDQLKNNPMPEGDLPTYNQKQVEANESIGWFIEDGLIKQVMTITPRKIEVIGRLDDNSMPDETI